MIRLAVCERGLSAPLALPPSVFHGFMTHALDDGQAGDKKKTGSE